MVRHLKVFYTQHLTFTLIEALELKYCSGIRLDTALCVSCQFEVIVKAFN
jgi:hypothetical protein